MGKQSSDLRQTQYVVNMWDGEGINRGARQDYVLLCNTTGLVLKTPGLEHLSTEVVFDTLIANRGDAKSLHVCYGGSYDVTMWLRSISDTEVMYHENGRPGTGEGVIRSIFYSKKEKRKAVPFRLGGYVYTASYQARKKFTLSRIGDVLADGTTKRYKKAETIIIWDIWGAYGRPFIGALQAFGIVSDLKQMARMKAARKTFTPEMIDEVTEYCLEECRWGAQLYKTTLAYASATGLVPKRHDGGGAFAAAMLRKEGVEEHLPSRDRSVNSQAVIDSIRRAFFGGRIENARIGLMCGVREYDINSAYPAQMIGLPSMIGSWSEHAGAPPITATPGCLYLVKLKWDFAEGLHFYPLPYRTTDGEVLFPNSGAGEYWHPEYRSLLTWCTRFHQMNFEVIGYRKFTPDNLDTTPLTFIERYYEDRLKNKKTFGVVLKICINSGYGKFAQQLGGVKASATEDLVLPPFFCQEWAGMITSGTRAQLIEAACLLSDPMNLVGFATDAVLVLEDLPLATHESELGAWGPAKRYVHAVVVQAGVRYVSVDRDEDHPEGWEAKTRGFPVRALPTPYPILSAWEKGESNVVVTVDRFYAFSSAILGADLWTKRGSWEEVEREIDITGDCPKRGANPDIWDNTEDIISWRLSSGLDFQTGIKHVPLRVKSNLMYQDGLDKGITYFSFPYENLESTQRNSGARLNEEYLEE